MKRAHRRTHKILWFILFPTLLLVLYFALTGRTSIPDNEILPATSTLETTR